MRKIHVALGPEGSPSVSLVVIIVIGNYSLLEKMMYNLTRFEGYTLFCQSWRWSR